MNRFTSRFVLFFNNYLFRSYIHVCFQLLLSSENMCHKAIWMGHPMRLVLTLVGLLYI